MMQIPVQPIPNQSFSIILDGNTWGFVIKSVFDSTVVSLTLNGVDILDSARAAPGCYIIPSQYEEAGNFFFTTQNFEIPYYLGFGTTQFLVYISAAELAILREPPSTPITAAYFNPIAALPLRFQPVGYLSA